MTQGLLPWLLKEEEKKPPKGFEKFFKRRGETKKVEEDSSKSGQKKEEGKEQKHDEEEAEDSESAHGEEKKHESPRQQPRDSRPQWQQFLFDQNNNPKPEGFLTILLAAAAGYYLLTYQRPMQELVYKDFLNEYLLKNNVKEINITKDKRSEVFNYRAEIVASDGQKFYMTLGSYESFLSKLDLVQREMGRQPHEFVPVKYTNQGEEQVTNMLFKILVGGLFLMFFYQIYKSRNQGGPGAGKPGAP